MIVPEPAERTPQCIEAKNKGDSEDRQRCGGRSELDTGPRT
jgi:hypothetical protein